MLSENIKALNYHKLSSVKWNASWVFLSFVTIFFFIFNFLTPEYGDDYIYKFVILNGKPNTDYPITNFKDIIISQIDHYSTLNGRCIVHIFVQLFTGLLGKSFFNFVNSILFCLLLIGITKLTSTKNNTFFTLSISSIILIWGIPCFNETFLWMTGSINYMWSACITMYFFLLLNIFKSRALNYKLILPYILIGIFMGWWHEGISLPLALSLIIFSILNWNKVHKSHILTLIIGYVIGALLCVLSSGNFSRAGVEEGFTIHIITSKIISGLIVCSKLKIFYLLIIFIIIKKFWFKESLKSWISNSEILIFAIFFSFFFLFCGFSTPRIAFGFEFFSLIALLILINTFQVSTKLSFNFSIISSSLIFILCLFLLPYSWANYRESESLFKQIKSNESSLIYTSTPYIPPFFERYIQRPTKDEWSEYYFGYSTKDWHNSLIASYYYREPFSFIPNLFMEKIKDKTKDYSQFQNDPLLPFWFKETNRSHQYKKLTYILRNTQLEEIPFYLRPLAKHIEKFSTEEVPVERFDYIEINGLYYLLINRNPNIDFRTIGIKAE